MAAKNQMLGCPVGPNDSIFNTRIDSLPVNSKSNAWIAASTPNPTTFEVDNWGISVADNATPTRTLKSYYSSAILPNFVMPAAGPNLKRQGGDYVGIFGFPNPPDHHVMTVKHTDCTFYESYDDYLEGYTRACRDGSPGCNVQTAITYPSMSYAVAPEGGTNAAGLPLAPAIWQLSEIQNGSINHATTFTTNAGSIAFNTFVWPAAATGGGCEESVCPNAMPLGTRLRLKSSFDEAALCNSGVTAEDAACKTMLTALKQYGMILSDTGLANSVQLMSEVTEDTAVTAAVQRLISARIPFSNFEAVDESSLEVKASSYQVCPLNTKCMNGVNSYVAPTTQAVISATDLSGASVETPVAIQPVGIGLGIPPIVAVATGNYSYQIPAWVNGSSDQTIHWKLVSGVGSVTSGGLYTPPPATNAPGVTEMALLEGVSNADSAAVIYLRLKVIQSASNGAVRIDTGSLTSTTDASANIWAADVGIEGGATAITSDYPHWNRSDPAAELVYESMQDGDDLGNTIIVPNGTYNVHLMFGIPDMGTCTVCTTWLVSHGSWNQYTFAPYVLEAQGQVRSSTFDLGALSNYMYQKPVDAYIPAVVTNNLLQVYVRSQMSDFPPYLVPVSSKRSILNGLEVLPYGSVSTEPPTWKIDTSGQSTIAVGQTLKPFSVVATGGAPNDPKWKILSGPKGAVLSGSQLSLAATSAPNSKPVVVQASDGIYSATASIATPANPAKVQSAFGYSRQLTIPHKYAGTTESLMNFPLLISVTDHTLANTAVGGHVVNQYGYDIVFTSDAAGRNLLPWEVESYNEKTGALVAHVMLPMLSRAVDTVIYMFYGNAKIVAQQVRPAIVWSHNYTGVYHFEAPPSFSTDSSGQGDAPLKNGLTYTSSGRIAGAAAAYGTTTSLPPSVLDQVAGTFETWISTTLLRNRSTSWVILSQAGATANDYFRLGWNGNIGGLEAIWSSRSAGSSVTKFSSTLPSSSVHTWNHVVYTWDANAQKQRLYWNGVPVGSASSAIPVLSSSTAVNLGAFLSSPSSSIEGLLDEVRFSNTARASDWVAAEYANQNAPASFVSIGAEVSHN